MTDQLSAGIVAAPDDDDLTATNGTTARRPERSVDDRLVPPRRRWPALVAGVALGVGGTFAVRAAVGDGSAGETAAEPVDVVQLATATVEMRDLVDEIDWAGTLAVGEVTSLDSPVAGTLTGVVNDGASIVRGDVVARIDERPIVAWFGSIPMWRALEDGVVGDDVFQLETNLVALGFDPDGIVTVDHEFTAATADMVEAWQAELGVEETGRVEMGDVVVLRGESSASTPAAIGSPIQVGSALATLETASAGVDVVARSFGQPDDESSAPTVESIAPTGTAVAHGTVLFTVDGVDAVAVIDVSTETAAVLAAFETDDLEEIESVLASSGFDPAGAMEIDDEFDDATAAAVERWQESIGLPSTGSVQAAAYVVVPGDREYAVAEPIADVGDVVGEGILVAALGSPTLSLTADVVVSEADEFEIGDTVSVEQVDESVFVAVVSEVAETTTQVGQDDPTVAVTFAVVESPDEFVSGSVVITTESSRIDDAIVVPTRALVTLAEVGFAVERAEDDGSRTLIGVELGTFDDGVVEIIDGDLEPGDRVVVPS